MRLSVSVEDRALMRNLTALSTVMDRGAAEITRNLSALYLISATKATPIAKQRKRKIVSGVVRYRRDQREVVPGGRVEAPGDKRQWWIKIPRQWGRKPFPYGATFERVPDLRSAWAFSSRSEAAAMQPIKYRGIGRAGFLAQMPRIGEKIPQKYAKEAALITVPGISRTVRKLKGADPYITMINTVHGIGTWANGGIRRIALSKVNNRIPYIARQFRQGVRRFRAAGGVQWNKQLGRYE